MTQLIENFGKIGLIAGAGFLDGIHPCAIAILIFFIGFLIAMQRNFKNIFLIGFLFIFGIFLTYLSVGVGLFSGIMFFGQHHFFAKLGSVLLIILGTFTLLSGFFPKHISGFKMPGFASEKSKELLNKATIPTVLLASFLVGLCAVPCSGGIYVSITALLASTETFMTGFFYLLLYNLSYVTPLVIILLLASSPATLGKLARWRKENEIIEKKVMGTLLIVLGLVIILFFI